MTTQQIERKTARLASLLESLRLSREAAERNADNPTGQDWDDQVARYEARIAEVLA